MKVKVVDRSLTTAYVNLVHMDIVSINTTRIPSDVLSYLQKAFGRSLSCNELVRFYCNL